MIINIVFLIFSANIVHICVHDHNHDHICVGIIIVIVIIIVVIVVIVIVLTVHCRDDAMDSEDGSRHHVQHVETVRFVKLTRCST